MENLFQMKLSQFNYLGGIRRKRTRPAAVAAEAAPAPDEDCSDNVPSKLVSRKLHGKMP